tara:strand:+ start:2191 stop:2643 length:453 start_codon:yes stop_codon:yes gene_type:complete
MEKYMNENIEEEIPIEELFDINDIINNDKTRNILLNQHYFDYLYKMEDKINDLYTQFKNNSKCYHFLDNDEFDLDGMFIIDIIYKYIYKKYTPDLFYDNLELAEPLFEDNTIKKMKNTTIIKNVNSKNNNTNTNNNSNKKSFDWNTKTYK